MYWEGCKEMIGRIVGKVISTIKPLFSKHSDDVLLPLPSPLDLDPNPEIAEKERKLDMLYAQNEDAAEHVGRAVDQILESVIRLNETRQRRKGWR